jgi:hypothetical protein
LIFLSRGQQETAYRRSLEDSAYSILSPLVHELWIHLVKKGLTFLLPGDLGRILERLLWTEVGDSLLGAAPIPGLKEALKNPVWKAIEQSVKKLPPLQEAPKKWANTLYYVFDYLDFGHSLEVHWGDVSELPLMKNTQEQLSSPETNFRIPLPDLWEREHRKALHFLKRSSKTFSMVEILRLHHPHLVGTAVMERILHTWEYRYQNLQKNIIQSAPIQENLWNVLDFAEPDIQRVGGYNDIELRGEGPWPALLPSELVYMEKGAHVDLFDQKFLENQLLFYKKDEGLDRKLRRVFLLDIPIQEESIDEEAVGKYYAFIEQILLIIQNLYQKDRVRFVLLLSQNANLEKKHRKELIKLLYLRISKLMPNTNWDIRFTMGKKYRENTWQQIYFGTQDKPEYHRRLILRLLDRKAGISRTSNARQEKSAVSTLIQMQEFLQGAEDVKVLS